MEPLDAQNILAFLERVTVTGTREAGEYLRCCSLLFEMAKTPPAEAPAEAGPTGKPKPALAAVPGPEKAS